MYTIHDKIANGLHIKSKAESNKDDEKSDSNHSHGHNLHLGIIERRHDENQQPSVVTFQRNDKH